jgi:hypothetical protein
MDEATKRIMSMKEHLVALKQAGLVTNEEFAELTA